MNQELKQQFTLRITQANATQLVVILYEMLLCYLDDMEDAARTQRVDTCHEAANHCRGCLNELLLSLHMAYEPALEMQKLYFFCIRRLAAAQRKCDTTAIAEIRRVIQPLHDAYEQIADQNDQGAVMNHTQTVYAGLTYGRNQLTENMTDQGANRGMLV